MELLKVLAMPFQMGSLLFVAASSLLFGLVISLGGASLTGAVLSLFVIWLLLTWLTNYALRLIDDVANGVRESRAASVEMLTDAFLDSRTWIHPSIAIVLVVLHELHPQWPVAPTLAAAVLWMPASLGACALSGHGRDALNPAMWWRVAYGLGAWYLLLVAFVAVCMLCGAILAQRLAIGGVLMACLQLLVLLVYAAIGGAIYERRLELGFDPRISPERIDLRLQAERKERRQQVIDGMYKDIRVREAQRAVASAREWLAGAEAKDRAGDVQAFLAAGKTWQELRDYPRLLQGLIPVLFELKQPASACAVAEAGLALHADFSPGTEEDTAALIGYALDTSRRRTGARLFDNFVKRAGNGYEPGPGLAVLRERLRPPA
jgi:hypothetical protein